jgi:hypothetical protein
VKKPNFPELAAREISLILATFEVTDIQALHADLKAVVPKSSRTSKTSLGAAPTFRSRTPMATEYRS